MSKYDNAIKHMLEIKFVNQYLIEFYSDSFKIISIKIPELLINSPQSIKEINRMMDERRKLELIINTMSEIDNLSERILKSLDNREDYDLIMTISLCNYIEELYKDFNNKVTMIIENLLKFSIIPEVIEITNNLNKNICDLRYTSVSELLDDNNKSYKFTNNEEDK